MLAIDVAELTKTYTGRPPVEAVRGIDLQVATGQCYGVLGPNGAGKTTTIEILEGLIPPSSGQVTVLGNSWQSDANEIRQQIGVSLQEARFSDKLSVRETLTLFHSFFRRPLSVDEAMGMVDLHEKANAWVKHLSGGQKQRLAVACAIIGNPKLLFLDEPTTGLDPTNRRQLWNIIRRFRQEGRTVLLTTHYMEEAERLCDRVAIIDQGTIIAEGPPAQLIAAIGAEHIIELRLDDPQGVVQAGQLESIPDIQQVRPAAHGFLLSVSRPHVVLPELIRQVARHQVRLTGLATRNATLEDVFLQLTGRQFQDGQEHPVVDENADPAGEPQPPIGRGDRV